MDEQTPMDVLQAIARATLAQSAILRDLSRHLVEEGYISSAKAARMFLDAAAKDMPPEHSTGETYNAAREEFVAIGTALLRWPGIGSAQPVPAQNSE